MTRNRRTKCIWPLRLFALCLSLSGCLYVPADPNYVGPKPLPAETLASYAYPRYQGSYTEKILEQKRHYTLKRISFPSSHNILPLEHAITIDYYAIDSAEKAPVIMVLPILGGGNDIAATFARYFAEHGLAAAVVHRQKDYKKPGYLKNIDTTLRQIVFDHMQAIDWIETKPELDATRIGVFGVSMGGIKGALISALDQRVTVGVFALVAGDIAYILSHTNEKRIKKERTRLMAERQLTPEEFQRELTAKIKTDPLNYAEYIDARKTLMILARFDRAVPYRKGWELREKIGNPATITLLSGHYSAILYIHYVKYQARKFLQRHLK